MVSAWPSIGGERYRERNCQGVEVPWTLALVQNRTPPKKETKNQKIPEIGTHKGRDSQGHRGAEGPVTGDLSGADRDLGEGLGRQREENRRGNISRRRHVAQGAEMNGRGWRVAGVGAVELEENPRRERRWEAGVA